MLTAEQTAFLHKRTVYMGTICAGEPRVRPMRPYATAAGLWLVSHAETEKVGEIADNNQVELCAADDKGRFIRVAGRLEREEREEARCEVFQGMEELQAGFPDHNPAELLVYRLVVRKVIWHEAGGGARKELNFTG